MDFHAAHKFRKRDFIDSHIAIATPLLVVLDKHQVLSSLPLTLS
jgi:hypothetical protein